MNSVAIVGVGLIGSSFGLALRAAGFTGDLIGVSSPNALHAGLARGAITRAASLEETARSADLIYLSQPVDRILTTLEALAELVPPSALITDAGSTKQVIVAKASALFSAAHFLGGHPLAGKEQRGADAADATLFRGRPYVLTPHLPPSPASREFRVWLERIGANVIEMSAQQHDSTVALTSHLPQILSTALALTLSRENNPQVAQVFGPALLDMTRLAASSPDLWLSILRTNHSHLVSALDQFKSALAEIQQSINSAELEDLFAAAASYAHSVRSPT